MEERPITWTRLSAISFLVFWALAAVWLLLVGVINIVFSAGSGIRLGSGLVFIAFAALIFPGFLTALRCWRAEGLKGLWMLRLSDEGLELRAFSWQVVIPWPEVEGLRVRDTVGGEFVDVRVNGPARVTVRGKWDFWGRVVRRRLRKKNILMISTQAARLPARELADEIGRWAGLLPDPPSGVVWLEEKPWRRLARGGAWGMNGAVVALAVLVFALYIDARDNAEIAGFLIFWFFGVVSAINLAALWAERWPRISFARQALVAVAFTLNIIFLMVAGLILLLFFVGSETAAARVVLFSSALWLAALALAVTALVPQSVGKWVERGSPPELGAEGT